MGVSVPRARRDGGDPGKAAVAYSRGSRYWRFGWITIGERGHSRAARLGTSDHAARPMPCRNRPNCLRSPSSRWVWY
jgi:hypothetical protein